MTAKNVFCLLILLLIYVATDMHIYDQFFVTLFIDEERTRGDGCK